MMLTTAQLDVIELFVREGVTRYQQPGYELYEDVVQTGKEILADLEANRQPYEDTRAHNQA